MGQGSWPNKVPSYLFGQHLTPCPITNKSPAELLIGWLLHTMLDRVHPQYTADYLSRQDPDTRQFQEGDKVFA